jgi:hypothetical protein
MTFLPVDPDKTWCEINASSGLPSLERIENSDNVYPHIPVDGVSRYEILDVQ